MKKTLFLLVGLLTSVNLFAQNGIDMIEGTTPISLPTDALIINGEAVLCDRMTWEIDDFGELGKTVRLIPTFSGETLQVLESRDALHALNFFVSGKVFLVRMKQGFDAYAICRGSLNKPIICAILATADGKTRCVINRTDETMVFNDFYKGMSKADVEECVSQIGTSRFVLMGTKDGLKCYSLKFLDMKKKHNIFGDYHYEVNNNKDYCYFYFDANNKLVKWIQFM